jgi:hypothetical protein
MAYPMTDCDYKKYTAQAKAAVKGEAFFEALVSDYSVPHHIVGSKDIGIDYICEWVYGDRPTGTLYAVQVRTLSDRSVKPALTTARTQDEEDFYKVNEGTTFLAFSDPQSKRYGFARDLFIDTMRCSYSKGSISYLSPRTLGLEQFPEEDAVFGDLFEEYSESILRTYQKTREYIARAQNDQAEPSAAPNE